MDGCLGLLRPLRAAALAYGASTLRKNRPAAPPRVTRTFTERAPQTRYSTDFPPELFQEPTASTVRASLERSITSSAPPPGAVSAMRRSPSRGLATWQTM